MNWSNAIRKQCFKTMRLQHMCKLPNGNQSMSNDIRHVNNISNNFITHKMNWSNAISKQCFKTMRLAHRRCVSIYGFSIITHNVTITNWSLYVTHNDTITNWSLYVTHNDTITNWSLVYVRRSVCVRIVCAPCARGTRTRLQFVIASLWIIIENHIQSQSQACPLPLLTPLFPPQVNAEKSSETILVEDFDLN